MCVRLGNLPLIQATALRHARGRVVTLHVEKQKPRATQGLPWHCSARRPPTWRPMRRRTAPPHLPVTGAAKHIASQYVRLTLDCPARACRSARPGALARDDSHAYVLACHMSAHALAVSPVAARPLRLPLARGRPFPAAAPRAASRGLARHEAPKPVRQRARRRAARAAGEEVGASES